MHTKEKSNSVSESARGNSGAGASGAPPPAIAVVGGGVAGLTAAWLLQKVAKVHLYERNDYIGGHTRTATIEEGPDAGTPVDMGFIVMNHRNYPLLTRLLSRLRVDLGDSDMSFGYRCEGSGYEYAGTSLRGLFAQPANLLRPTHWGMLRDIMRFNEDARRQLREGALRNETLGEFLKRGGYGHAFAQHYLLAMGAAIWSSPSSRMLDFPARAFLRFFNNHGLLTPSRRLQWRYVRGGSQTYVREMLRTFLGEVVLNARLSGIRRMPGGGAMLRLADGSERAYSHLVLAAHADESLALLDDPSPRERELLGAWQYQQNDTILHTDTGVMPRARAAWASWNFSRAPGDSGGARPVSITYHMNRLQQLRTRQQYFVTLNREPSPDPARILQRVTFTHPVYSAAALNSQDALRDLNGTANTYYAGSYLGYGFHEDAVRSAVDVAAHFGVAL